MKDFLKRLYQLKPSEENFVQMRAFAEEHEKWKSAFRKRVESEQIQKCISGIKEKIKDALNCSDKKDEEPMVERDFEG